MEDLRSYLYNQFDPARPADLKSYVDCHEERGGLTFVEDCLEELKIAMSPQCFLFSGHIGCGKSSELRHFKAQLENQTHVRFLPVLIDANE
jgi:hypothetical protein